MVPLKILKCNKTADTWMLESRYKLSHVVNEDIFSLVIELPLEYFILALET